MNRGVDAVTVYDGKLIAGGYFTTAGGVQANFIASWDGADWSALGSGMGDLPCSVVADAGRDSTVECGGWPTTAVALDGTGSYDPNGDPLAYLWWASGVAFDDPTSSTPIGQFPLGMTTARLIVSTNPECADTDYVNITVEDTTPPEIVVGLN
jgi:hypothetical protein